jgi:multidrug efflux pump subunit AcrB
VFDRFLTFFIENTRINYLIFFLITALGIYSYMKTPKEIFPTFELDMITISGGYAGASIDILDKMAVRDIEDSIKSIDGVKEVTSIIKTGSFSIMMELNKGEDKYELVNEVKDSVDLVKVNFPSDMDDPTVRVVKFAKDLLNISLSSSVVTKDILIDKAKELERKIAKIKNVSNIDIYGDSDIYFDIVIDEKKLLGYDINYKELVSVISKLSYIFPIGKIEDSNGHFLVSTYNGKKSAEELLKSRVKVSGKVIYLKDVASIQKRYEDSDTISSFNEKASVQISVSQNENANALEVSKQVKELIEKESSLRDDITYTLHDDNSNRIRDRLNIVVSNIIFGVLLLTILIALLVNGRMSLIIIIGIPTSFIIAMAYFYISGYTINMISLVGVLIALGIVVDDAIVVSENIQQYIERGYEPKEAAYLGAKEMAEPVILASLTTIFAFIPALMISGTMGEFIKLIPIAVSSLVIASLIESFIFLPIHASHILSKDAKALSWEKANRVYSTIIHLFLKYKKSFLVMFLVLIPLFTVITIKNSKFQMFPKFDATKINISIKSDVNTTVEQSYEKVKGIEKILSEKTQGIGVESISSIAGYGKGSDGKSERYPYVGYITVELAKPKPTNFVDEYITPYLSFYYDDSGRVRELSSIDISQKLRDIIEQNSLKEKFDLVEISVLERKAGPVKSDIKVGFSGYSNELIADSINRVENELAKIGGIKSHSNSAKFGVKEIKLKVNSYGEKLGITESTVGDELAGLFLERKVALSFDEYNLLEIKTTSLNRDFIDTLKNYYFDFNNQKILLSDVVEFIEVASFEKVEKLNGIKNFYLYANVDPKIKTATEVLEELEPILKEVEERGIVLSFEGEKKKNAELKNDMIAASALALLLILISMMYLFNSFRETAILMSVIPFSFLGVLIGHTAMGMNLSMPSIIGGLGLAGVVINDGIIMMTYLKRAKNLEELFKEASKRFRPIVLTSVTTLIGLSTLIFFPSGEAVIFQPIAVSLGFGLAWGTILNLLYLPTLYGVVYHKRLKI